MSDCHGKSDVQRQQLQSEQHPEEINFTFMWSVTILLIVPSSFFWRIGEMLYTNALSSRTKIMVLILCSIPFEHAHRSPFISNIISISVTGFCWIAASCWCPYIWNQVTGQILYIFITLSLLSLVQEAGRQGFFGRSKLEAGDWDQRQRASILWKRPKKLDILETAWHSRCP